MTDQRRGQNHDKGHHGDPLRRKKENCIRILLHNPGGIGFVSNQRSKETLKMEKLKKLILEQNVDITCLTEVNKDWRTIAYDNTIWGATIGWREHRRVQVAHNRTVAPGDSEFQVGGSAMLMLGDVTFRISAQGADSRNLGRWSFITLTGKNSITTTVFT